MKNHIFLMDALTDVDDDLIAQAENIRPKRPWAGWVAAAAALSIIVGSVFHLPNHLPGIFNSHQTSPTIFEPQNIHRDPENISPTLPSISVTLPHGDSHDPEVSPPSHPIPPVTTTPDEPIEPDTPTVPPEDPRDPETPIMPPEDTTNPPSSIKPLSVYMPGFGQGLIGDLSSVESSSSSSSGEHRSYINCLTAKAVEILPDTYHIIGDSSHKFRLVRMNVIRSVLGQCMVDSFYYILPEDYLTELTQYDALVIPNVQQFGHINYVLYNDSAQQLEATDLVVLGFYTYLVPDITAFTDGQLDTSLWTSTDAWIEDSGHRYVAPEYSTLEAYEQKLRDGRTCNDIIRPTIDAQNSQVTDALTYVQPFENGVFIPQPQFWVYSDTVCYRRYINGYPTTETVHINPNNVYYGYQYTDEDIQSLPNLAGGLLAVNEAYNTGHLTPPHLKNWESMRFIRYVIFGWYAKTANGVHAVIRVSWMYADDTQKWQDDWFHYDDQYYIFDKGTGNYESIEYEALTAILGENATFVAKADKYDDTGRVNTPSEIVPHF